MKYVTEFVLGNSEINQYAQSVQMSSLLQSHSSRIRGLFGN